MKLTMTAFLPHLQPAAFLNQRDKFFYFHVSKVSPKSITFSTQMSNVPLERRVRPKILTT